MNKNKIKNSLSLYKYLCLSVGCAFFMMGAICFGSTKNTTQLSLTIINSFTGSTSLTTTGLYLSGHVFYTSGFIIDIVGQASVSSTYTLSGDIQTFTGGIGSGNYIYTHTTILANTGTDGYKYITSNYATGFELLTPPPIQIYLDTTPPTSPILYSPTVNSTTSTSTFFDRSTATDMGVGNVGYTLVISDDPSFSSSTTFDTSLTGLVINNNLLPTGQLYRYITASDKLGNSTDSIISFFTNQPISPPSTGNNTGNITTSGGGGGTNTYNLYVDNIKIDDPYSCRGNIYGFVTSNDLIQVSVSVTLQGQETYVFYPVLHANGYYEIPLEYDDIDSQLYVTPGTYYLTVIANHPSIGTDTFSYEIHITGDCDNTITPQHPSSEVYTKKPFTFSKYIKQQNIPIRIAGLKQISNHIYDQNEQARIYDTLQLPAYLQQTGANPHDIIQHLEFVIQHVTNKEHIRYIRNLISTLQADRYLGMYFVLFMYCYDLQFFARRYTVYLKQE